MKPDDDLDARMRSAVAAGMRDVLGDDDLMDSVLDRLLQRIQRGAAERTGRWLWGTIRVFFTRWMVIGLIVLMVGQYIGWGPAKTVFGWLTNQGGRP